MALSCRKGDLYCLNCFNSYTTENKLKKHEEVCNNHDSYHMEMPKQTEKTLKYIYGEKSLKAPFAIYLDLEYLLKKEQSCQNNPAKSYTEKKAIHEPSSCSFDENKNKLNYYGGKDCIEKLCKKLKKRGVKIKKKKSLIKNKHFIYVKKSFVMIKLMKTILIKK